MRTTKPILLIAGLTLVTFAPAQAHASWLPFASRTKASTPAKNTGGSSVPIVSSLSQSTKKLVSSPTSLLASKKQTPVRQSGTTGLQSSKSKQEKPGFFKSLFYSEPPPPPKTIKDWMKLKQIHP